jgi:2-methylcitrate dehydratase PrpD
MSKQTPGNSSAYQRPDGAPGQRPGRALAEELADWAVHLEPTAADLDLAERALLDTVAVALAARGHALVPVAGSLPDAARWASIGHVLDFDDLHLPSTAHVSVVCVPAVLARGGDARAYLAAAGVMARLGAALGWEHYTSGWHATCTAGAPAAAVGAGISLGLDERGLAHAIALAVPAAGGVQRAFGTPAKSLQVGFAAQAGVVAATLVADGASADPSALDQWLPLVGGDPRRLPHATAAVPGGLAIKLFPCCYALQRPISATRTLLEPGLAADEVARAVVRTPQGSLQPLIHHNPTTGLQGKFSLEYAIAATLLDGYPGFGSFTDDAVNRPAARRLMERVEVVATPGGEGLLAGEARVELRLRDGTARSARLELPPGAPERPPSGEDLRGKLADCGDDVPGLLDGLSWRAAAPLLREQLPARHAARHRAHAGAAETA